MKKYLFTLFVLLTLNTFPQDFDIIWQGCYGGSEKDVAQDIYYFGNKYLISGYTLSNDYDISYNHGGGDGWVLMIDSTGNILWEKTYGGSLGDWFIKMINYDSTIYLIGITGSSDGDISYDPYPGSYDIWIVKININGDIIWDKIIGSQTGESVWNVNSTPDGGILIAASINGGGGDISTFYGLNDSWYVKIDSTGEIVWDFTIGTDWVDVGQAAIQTTDGGYLLASNSIIHEENTGNITCTPHSYGYKEGVLFKLDSNLNVEWQHCYGGSDSDGITGLMEVDDGYVFGGHTYSNDGDVSGLHGESDLWIVKIDYDGNIVWQNALGGSESESYNNLLQTIKSNPAKTFYGAMIGAGILYGGYKIYQRFLSKAARACSNKSGEEKTACIAQYRNNAIKAQIMELKKGLSVCAKTNNPAKCKATIEDKIKKLQNKLG